MKTIKGDLVLTKDTTFDEDLKVEGNIKGNNGARYNLKVVGDIDARDIDALDIHAWDIDARNIYAWNIDAGNIIFCQTIKLKDKSKGKIESRNIHKTVQD